MYMIKPKWHWRGELIPVNLGSYDSIALHHMAHSTADYWEVEKWHHEKGWIGIGYNFWISKKGDIIEGRGFHEPAGVKGHNGHIISIGFQGDYDKDPIMPTEQILAGQRLLVWLIPKLKSLKVIAGHNNWNDTSCPGKHFPLSVFQCMLGSNNLLRKGSKGDSVKELQQMLVKVGYEIDIDGDFGLHTENAVIAFQRGICIDDDGIAGEQTISRLKELIKRMKDFDPVIHIVVNGSNIDSMFDVKPRLINDRVFVPIRALSESLGYTVSWDETTKTVSIVK